MKIMKKIGVFALVALLLCSLFSISVFATDTSVGETQDVTESATEVKEDDGKLDMSMHGQGMTFAERLEYAVQGTVTGLLMVFAVLILLTIILYISKYVFYDIPNKKKENARVAEEPRKVIPAEPIAAASAPVAAVAPTETEVIASQDDGELVAVITAAIAAMIESGDYKNEFVGGFRVVSFKRSTQNAWNRK